MTIWISYFRVYADFPLVAQSKLADNIVQPKEW